MKENHKPWWTYLEYFLPDGRRRWMYRRETDGLHAWIDGIAGDLVYVLPVVQDALSGPSRLSGPIALRGWTPDDEVCATVDREHPPNAEALAAYIAAERQKASDSLALAEHCRDKAVVNIEYHALRLAALAELGEKP